MKDYIERAVADIARKCHANQDEVWQEMYESSVNHLTNHLNHGRK